MANCKTDDQSREKVIFPTTPATVTGAICLSFCCEDNNAKVCRTFNNCTGYIFFLFALPLSLLAISQSKKVNNNSSNNNAVLAVCTIGHKKPTDGQTVWQTMYAFFLWDCCYTARTYCCAFSYLLASYSLPACVKIGPIWLIYSIFCRCIFETDDILGIMTFMIFSASAFYNLSNCYDELFVG